MKKIVCLLAVLCVCFCARAEESPESVALQFFKTLTAGDYASAASLCVDGDDVRAWNPPVITRDIVYPSVCDLTVTQNKVTGKTAQITLSAKAADIRNEEVEEQINLPVWDHLACEIDGEDEFYSSIDLQELQEFLQEFTAYFSVPVCLTQQNDGWKVDEQATFALWAADTPLSVRAVSYGLITYDTATLKYEDTSQGLPPWKIWLRLESDEDVEELSEFSLENGLCSPTLEQHHDFYAFGYNSVAKCWKEYGGAYHAVLRLERLPAEGTLQAVRRQNIYTPLYVQRSVRIPFSNVPYDDGVPENGVRFAVKYYNRIAEEVPIQRWKDTYMLRTMGDFLDDFDRFETWVWEDLPDVRDLPVINEQYALYMLHGAIEKEEGCFGVYDVMLHTDSRVILPLFSQCSMCEVNSMRYFGADSGTADFAQMPFSLPVLIPLQEGVDPDVTLREMVIEAAFSGEMIDYLGAHDSATRLGPRSTVLVDLGGMQRWEGSVRDMPQSEHVRYWDVWQEEEDDEETFITIDYELSEDEKGAG